jgi:hypothetical protein
VKRVTGNPSFATPAPALAVVTAAIDDLRAAEAAPPRKIVHRARHPWHSHCRNRQCHIWHAEPVAQSARAPRRRNDGLFTLLRDLESATLAARSRIAVARCPGVGWGDGARYGS